MTDCSDPSLPVKIFRDDKMYDHRDFKEKGCGGRTLWWKLVKKGAFPVRSIGRSAKATGADLNKFLSSISTN